MNRSMLLYALGALFRRRSKAIALTGGLSLVVAFVAAVLFLTDALKGEAERARDAVPDVVVQRLVGGRPSTIPIAETRDLAGLLSVERIEPRVWGYLFVPTIQGNVTVVGVREGRAPLSEAPGGALSAGKDVKPGAHEMIAGTTLAKALGLRVGDGLQLPSATPSPLLTLVGTFDSRVELYAADVILCDEADARAVLGMPDDSATDIAIHLKNPTEARVVARTVQARLAGVRVVEKESLGRVYSLAYGRRSGLVLAAAIPAILALLILAWDRVSGLGPEEKREIAIMKATGWSTRDVLQVKLLEASLVGSFGTAIGLAMAYVWVFVLGAAGLRAALAGWSVLYPEAPLTPMVDVVQLLGVALSVVAPFVSLSIVPAWRAAGTDPMEAMRGS
jgi:ABC-type lipoprotein release transport system permease subunit